MTEIINFHSYKERKEQDHFDEIVKNHLTEEEFVKDFAIRSVYKIIDDLSDEEIYVENDVKAVYDIILLSEVIKGLVYRSIGNEHPMHDIGESLFDIPNPTEMMEKIMS